MKLRMRSAVFGMGMASRLRLAAILPCMPFAGAMVLAAEEQVVTLDSFLACAEQADRGARIACLETPSNLPCQQIQPEPAPKRDQPQSAP